MDLVTVRSTSSCQALGSKFTSSAHLARHSHFAWGIGWPIGLFAGDQHRNLCWLHRTYLLKPCRSCVPGGSPASHKHQGTLDVTTRTCVSTVHQEWMFKTCRTCSGRSGAVGNWLLTVSASPPGLTGLEKDSVLTWPS